jgi:hypothetical protein
MRVGGGGIAPMHRQADVTNRAPDTGDNTPFAECSRSKPLCVKWGFWACWSSAGVVAVGVGLGAARDDWTEEPVIRMRSRPRKRQRRSWVSPGP